MRTGFVGWRGMVGSVLLERMHAEQDFDGLQCTFYSTSSPGRPGPDVGHGAAPLHDAHDLVSLAKQQVIISCQGGNYTKSVFGPLRDAGWKGIWIDAASALRMQSNATLVLDPVNGHAVRSALRDGGRTFVGANCTVSLMLMGLVGLIRTGRVQWISSMTYQAASGGGARHMRELVAQMRAIGQAAGAHLDAPNTAALDLDRCVRDAVAGSLPTAQFGAPLAASAIPWIDQPLPNGQTREEWKAGVEASKILGEHLPVDGLCVRIGAMRCHAQALTIKLDAPMHVEEATEHIRGAHDWVDVVPNTQEQTLDRLTPAAVAGALHVPVGRLRAMTLGDDYLTCFTVGDQLLWGAAEPLRRMLRIVREENASGH